LKEEVLSREMSGVGWKSVMQGGEADHALRTAGGGFFSSAVAGGSTEKTSLLWKRAGLYAQSRKFRTKEDDRDEKGAGQWHGFSRWNKKKTTAFLLGMKSKKND